MENENSQIQAAAPFPEPRNNILNRITGRIPKPLFVVLLVLISIPVIFFLLRGREGLFTSKQKSEFELVESSPPDQENSISVIARPTFVFSKKIGVDEKELGKYFSITPKVDGKWHIEKNGQVVYFSTDKKQERTYPQTFAYQTTYTVTIDKSFKSQDGKTLSEDEEIAFKTRQNPAFGLTAGKSLVPAIAGESVEININYYGSNDNKYTNDILKEKSQPYDITIQKATKEELLSYFRYKKNFYLSINSIPDTLLRKPSIKTTGQYLEKGRSEYGNVIHVENSVFKTPGIYFVTFSNKYGYDRLFIVVSKHIAKVVHDNTKSYVMTEDAILNKAVSGIKVEYYKTRDSVALLDTKTTNNDGIAIGDQAKNDTDFIITSKGDDIAVTQTRSYRMGGVKGEDIEVFSYTDRPIYRPGDPIHYKAVIRIRDENGDYSIKKKTYYIKYSQDYNLQKDNYKEVTTDENGTVTFDTVLPISTGATYPSITLATKNEKGEYVSLDSLPILVDFYKKPDMDISVATNEKEYISGDTSHMNVVGKTNYGQPLSNIKFTYRVMLVDYDERRDRNEERIEKDIYANYYGGGVELANGASQFDKNGKVSIEFPTKLPDNLAKSQAALLEVTPNIGAIPSFGKIVRLIHRGEFALFFDDVEGDVTTGLSGYIEAFNHKNPRQTVGNMKGKLFLTKKDYYSDNGQLIDTRDVELDDKGRAGFTFRDLKQGSYEIKSEFMDARNNKVTATEMVYVGGPAKSAETQNSMNVVFDKQKYKEGETARATITANFMMGDVYVVTAKNKIGSTRIASVEIRKGENRTSSFTVSVPVTKDDKGDMGIAVYSNFNAKTAQAQGTFTVDKKSPKIKTDIRFDKNKYKPGEQVKVTIVTKDEKGNGVSADNSLSIIDAALLQLGKLKEGIAAAFNASGGYISLSYYDSMTGIYADGPGGGGGCFLEATKILMADGTSKNIENIHVGDAILTKGSEVSSEMVKNTVEKTFVHTVTEYLLINNTLKVTPIHRIYLNGKWAEASDAKVGDTLLDAKGATVEISSIVKMQGIFRVFNLTTTPSHTFFADGIYVHNEKGLDARQNFVDTLYWNPHIKTDDKGEASVSFKLADNVTTFTAQAFSNTKDSLFGEGTASIVSYRELTLIPSLSNFYYQHDKPVITVIAQNSTNGDMDLSVITGIKELQGDNKQDIHVKGNDLETIEVPFDLKDLKKEATFIVEARDKSGKVIDSVLMKRPVLPQGNITANWNSFENSYTHTFAPQYPTLDTNRMVVSIVPNAAAKLAQPYYGIGTSLSDITGQQLFAYSYILARTRDGFIDPTSYKYAQYLNYFRDAVETLSEGRNDYTWTQPDYHYYDGGETFESANLWVAMGYEKAVENNMLNEITDAKDMVNRTKEYFRNYGGIQPPPYNPSSPTGFPPPPPIEPLSPSPAMYPTPTVSLTPTPSTTASGIIFAPPPIAPTVAPYNPQSSPPSLQRYYTNNEKVVRTLMYGQTFPDGTDNFNDTSSGLAVSILSGKSANIEQLLALRVVSASDRYIWSGYNTMSAEMPVLALVEKGNIDDAEKAVRGISFTEDSPQPLTLYAAVKYAERKNITISKPSYKVTIDGENVFEYPSKDTENYYELTYSHEFSTKNTRDGKLHLKIEYGGGLPVYGTVSEFAYISQGESLGQGNYHKADINFTRSYRDVESGQTVGSLEKGKTGIVVFTSEPSRLISNGTVKSTFSFLSEDAISPNYLYLDQNESYYNPQFQSVLKKFFPSEQNQLPLYSLPVAFSDQAVFYGGNDSAQILPYVVFNASGGTYFRPKASIIFPVLGVIADEK